MRNIQRILPGLILLSSMAVCMGADIKDETQEIAQLLQIGPSDSIADVGAGNGDWSVALAEIVGEEGQVFATEVDSEKVEKLDRLIKRRKLSHVESVLGSQDATGLKSNSVDAILLRLVYHHFANPEVMQADLKAALKPGGRIAIIDFGPENNFPRSSVPNFRNGHGVVAETIIEEMTAAGFKLEERRDQWNDNQQRYLLVFSVE